MQTCEWQPMSTMPRDGRPFLAADYAPTNWAYYVRMVRPAPYMQGAALERFLETNTRYARAWMPCPPEPPVALCEGADDPQ